MNNQIVTHQQAQQRNVPPGAIDVWANSQNGAGTQLGAYQPQHAQPAASSVATVQRLLRGRIALAIVLAGIGAIIGGVAGYMSQAPTYRAVGLLQISPVIPIVEGDKTMPYYQQFMTSQAYTIASPQVMNTIPQNEPWKSTFKDQAASNAALASLGSGLKSQYIKGSFNIQIQLEADETQTASVGMQSLIAAYKNFYKENKNEVLKTKLDEWNNRRRKFEADKIAADAAISEITGKYGSSNLEGMAQSAQAEVEEIRRELRSWENNWKAASSAMEVLKAQGGGNKIPVEELAQVDSGLAGLMSDLRAAIARYEQARKQLGENNPNTKKYKDSLDIINASVEATADAIRKDVLAIVPDFVRGGFFKVTPGQMKVLEQRVAQLRSDVDEREKRRAGIARDAGLVATSNVKKTTAENELKDVLAKLEQLNFQIAMSGDLEIMQDGKFPAQSANKKLMFGVVGAGIGAMLPVGILLLLGLMDTRFRYSDDAAGQSMAGIPLLGILPNLPDRLSDPAQASIAAHCVHQIRTMLQLNAMRDGGTIFSVTSASSGDGKTSLALALGLSFAGSGSRTLLIDADLVGGGLTTRLGNSSPLGIVDSLSGVPIDDVAQPTDVPDLALLPIGSAQAHHAGSFSPPAVRKLLAEIRKAYDVIIIDTGPIMGSIEATPIAASVDGVVLTVARGQSRPLVERAITHLQSIGARVCGVVFNRAQHKDFEQSIGAISIRSAARSTVNGTGHNARRPGDIGAVAQAVATSGGTRDN